MTESQFIEVDSYIVPFLLTEYWTQPETDTVSETADTSRRTPLYRDTSNIFEGEKQVGELYVSFPENGGITWTAFRDDTERESVYRTMHTSGELPAEVLTGNPNGEPYWYAILLAEPKTEIAKKIRAQDGFLYDDQFIPNPTWDLSPLIDRDNLTGDIETDPRGILAPDYSIHSSALPPRFGHDTVTLLAELVWVGAQFEGIYVDDEQLPSPQTALSCMPEDIEEVSLPLEFAYRFHTTLIKDIYECVQNNPDMSIETLVEQGDLPDPEVLYRSKLQFQSRVHELKAYFKKMKQVPVEEYVIDALSGNSVDKLDNIPKDIDASGFPLLIRRVLYDRQLLLDEISDILKVTPYIVDVQRTETEFAYNVRGEKKAIEYTQKHAKVMISNMTLAEMGGEDPGAFAILLPRLSRRHDWFNVSALGAGGKAIDAMLREIG